MDEIKAIFDDKREIESISQWGDSEGEQIYLSIESKFPSNQAEKIIAYKEHGPMGWIPYLAIYKNGEIWQRINATKVSIVYSKPLANSGGQENDDLQHFEKYMAMRPKK